MGAKPNRLINEMSPYLLQHAHNPVNWYPWGPEALETAAAEAKPILLSVGYAACHWCHVMERESFEDEETARFMNEHFVCIKVDREERPDIDSVYMDAVQAMTGRGGWPMTMFLTPEGFPFFGGTYFPPNDSHGLPSFRKILEAVTDAWANRRSELALQGRDVAERIQQASQIAASVEPLTSGLLAAAAAHIGEGFDGDEGGYGGAPKFPQAPLLEFLLRSGSESARRAAVITLEKMAEGGIYDQLGGGFHRYSVDARWLVPHFEKMLYDNAQLARLYTHAWQATNKPLFRRIAEETLEYLMRDMRHADGGFYSSEDADSEGVEGKFYVWDYDEFVEVAPDALAYYGVTSEGNFEGSNILTGASTDPPAQARASLLAVRSKRVRPARDEKILTSWNGLAIAAYAEAGAVFGRRDFVQAAEGCAAFVLGGLRSSGRLLHSYKDGRASVLGMLEDHAFLADGLFCLWEATFEPRWFEECRLLASSITDLFSDADGGFFSTGSDHEQLIVRQKELAESATPSPGGIAALTFQKLALLTGDREAANRAVGAVRVARTYMERAPQAVPSYLAALDFYLSTPKEVVIFGPREDPRTRALVAEVWSRFMPNKVLAGGPPGIESPLMEGKSEVRGAPTAFVCENYSCRMPVNEPADLAKQLV